MSCNAIVVRCSLLTLLTNQRHVDVKRLGFVHPTKFAVRLVQLIAWHATRRSVGLLRISWSKLFWFFFLRSSCSLPLFSTSLEKSTLHGDFRNGYNDLPDRKNNGVEAVGRISDLVSSSADGDRGRSATRLLLSKPRSACVRLAVFLKKESQILINQTQ